MPQVKTAQCPLSARVSIDGEQTAFSIKMRVPVAIWDGKSSRAKGRAPEAYQRHLQKFIDNVRNGVMYGEWNDDGRLL